MKPANNKILQKLINLNLNKPLIFNHFEKGGCISTKSGLLATLKSYYSKNKNALDSNFTEFNVIPHTFVIDGSKSFTFLYKFIVYFQGIYPPDWRM